MTDIQQLRDNLPEGLDLEDCYSWAGDRPPHPDDDNDDDGWVKIINEDCPDCGSQSLQEHHDGRDVSFECSECGYREEVCGYSDDDDDTDHPDFW